MHATTARVRYAETDAAGVAYHANYLLWFEVGRTEMLRELGFPYGQVERDHRLFLTVTETAMRFLRPARYDDLLRIETRVTALRRVRLRLDTRILDAASGELLCDGHLTLACVDADALSPKRLPRPLEQALAGVLEAAD